MLNQCSWMLNCNVLLDVSTMSFQHWIYISQYWCNFHNAAILHSRYVIQCCWFNAILPDLAYIKGFLQKGLSVRLLLAFEINCNVHETLAFNDISWHEDNFLTSLNKIIVEPQKYIFFVCSISFQDRSII